MITKENITELEEKSIFVFASNEAGKHESGSAKTALNFGAIYGQGVGLQGNTYAIPTIKDKIDGVRIPLEFDKIRNYSSDFCIFAKNNPHLYFHITKIGCGLAGYTVEEIAPLFEDCILLDNCNLSLDFLFYYLETYIEIISIPYSYYNNQDYYKTLLNKVIIRIKHIKNI